MSGIQPWTTFELATHCTRTVHVSACGVMQYLCLMTQPSPVPHLLLAGHTDCVKALIAAGCQIGAGAQDDMNALHFAAQKNSVQAARWLINEGEQGLIAGGCSRAMAASTRVLVTTHVWPQRDRMSSACLPFPTHPACSNPISHVSEVTAQSVGPQVST